MDNSNLPDEKNKFEISQNELRVISGIVLLILTIIYLWLRSDNKNIEYVIIALALFLVGFKNNSGGGTAGSTSQEKNI